MQHIKARLFGVVLIVLGVALVYLNWRDLWTEGTYSTKLAAFGPVVAIGGVFLLLFPARAGKPTTTAEKVTVLIVLAIGLVAGVINWTQWIPGFSVGRSNCCFDYYCFMQFRTVAPQCLATMSGRASASRR